MNSPILDYELLRHRSAIIVIMTTSPREAASRLDATALELSRSDETQIRKLSLEERGRLVETACRAAAEIYYSRLRNGLPDVQPAPWPASTLEFLRKHAPNGRS